MSPVELLLVAVGGGAGAALRFVLDGLVKGRVARSRFAGFPVGTLLINVSGSLLLGVLTGLGQAGTIPASTVAVLGTGMMGGYTTFSTASVETVQLLRSGKTRLAVLNGLGMLVVSVGAAALGLWIGRNS
ncbi:MULTISPECIES: fluoride efflux transporter CrcB [Curtobacterium]|jgi:CrcB protein|uniref:Fluoride-specific ion channel FluC n=1 Tax=Curtobacterium poinsettiae TaxID=159612 RepID=A0ABT3RXA8_9MICO|nr:MULTISPECIES: fluoride efflux transporter CrcB [Curtobacterium]KIQ07620.1 chromosome condensation protein CrcB [Curtobacterium flaccumfaciens]MBF4598406.1 fluoride efflux transporter CrcB [Curtobacterium sp. VKM Ac-1796]MBF4611623.1 fluoride efflux transporter CrcB [Curtobacterium sp. VKM Ac-2889]MBT1610238.1 fluoride efflux transporter CrcB [Curtobacterium flaccumfaciens pv. poinsettiae]MBT1619772.1 fluoride efflux transporter CrcB [Curtobacterium flaccumfaciens pv. poinsettiae]